MKISPTGIERIKRYEACSFVVYDDVAGLATIGWGHLIKPGEHFTKLTLAEAEALLEADLAPAVEAVNRDLAVDVTQEQFDSLVSFVFNVGAKAFHDSSLRKAINAGADPSVIRASLKLWCKARDPKTGALVVVKGLAIRRADEATAWPT